MEASFNYNRTFGDHTVTALVLYNQQKEYYPNYIRTFLMDMSD